MSEQPFTIIGDLINNSYGRAGRAFQDRDLAKYQELATGQVDKGATYLDVNIDATQRMSVNLDDMLDFLPDLIPALQEATDAPLCFDNPSIQFQEKALSIYERKENNKPILNSISASRQNLDDMIALVKEYDTKVVVMASEIFVGDDDYGQAHSGQDVYEVTKTFVKRLQEEAGRTTDDIIVDPGLAPLAADTYGIVNMGLDAMRLIRKDPDLEGIHISVGLTNFSFGVPKAIKTRLEHAYITLAVDAGLDTILGNPEKDLQVLPADHRFVTVVGDALELGRPVGEESQEDAGMRQAVKTMELFKD